MKIQKKISEGNFQDTTTFLPYSETELISNLNLANNSYYRYVGRAVDSAGNPSNGLIVSWDWFVDSTAPNTPSNVRLSGFPAEFKRKSPRIFFDSSADSESGISGYHVRLRSTLNTNIISILYLSPAQLAAGGQFTFTSDTLIENQTYFVEIVAINNTGLISAPVTSPTWVATYYGIICPSSYVGVGDKEPYTSQPFCVSQFEMKISGQSDGNQVYNSSFVPEARATGTPWTNLNQSQARAECQSLGANYDLISNDQWQTLAHNIELNPLNWTSGVVGNQILFQGNSDGQTALSVTDQNDSYNQTNNNAGEVALFAKSQKRVFNLGSGMTIWDLAGNVEEWTRSSQQTEVYPPGVSKNILELNDLDFPEVGSNGRTIRVLYGASQAYPSISIGPFYGGLGYYINYEPNPQDFVDIGDYLDTMANSWHSGIIRGNSSVLSSLEMVNNNFDHSGVFTASNNEAIASSPLRGFRCVWIP